MSDQEFQKFLDQVEEMLKEQGKKLSELAKQLLQNNTGQLEKHAARGRARRASCRASSARSRRTTSPARSRARSASTRSKQEIKELREQLEKLDIGSELKAKMEEYLDRRLKALDDIIRRYVRHGAREARHQARAKSSGSTSSARRASTI